MLRRSIRLALDEAEAEATGEPPFFFFGSQEAGVAFFFGTLR
jgi:hypothetical protein